MDIKKKEFLTYASEIILKWYEQTKNNITNRNPSRPNLDSELLGILLATKSQANGALTLLSNNHILSTHCILRNLLEAYAVLRWSLNVSEADEKTKSEKIYNRLLSWELDRLYKDKAFLEEQPKIPEIKSNIEQVKSDIDNFEKAGIEKLHSIQALYNELGRGWGKVYTLYRKYSRAVHINRNITQKFAWIEYENEKPKATLYKDDIEADGDEILNIASISHDINTAINNYYGWNCETIHNEYEQLKSSK